MIGAKPLNIPVEHLLRRDAFLLRFDLYLAEQLHHSCAVAQPEFAASMENRLRE